MTQNMVTVDGVKVDSTLAQPTHIHIHIHQESAWMQLLKAGRSLKEYFAKSRGTGPPKARLSYGQLAGGVTQILLGVVSCAFGVLLYFGPWTELRGTGCAFWAGSVAIAAGVGALAHERCRSTCSGWVSGLLTLAAVATAVAAVVLCVNSIIWENNSFLASDSLCERASPDPTTTGYEWRQWNRNDEEDWQEQQCKDAMQTLRNFFLGVRILLLAIYALQAIVSLTSLGLGLRSLYGKSSQPMDEEESEKKLLGENSVPPSPSREKSTAIMVL